MFICLTTILIGFTYPLNVNDQAALNAATQNCSKYFPDAPCLVKFIKKEEYTYNSLCGKKVKRK